MRITIAGKIGSGKSTVSKYLAEKFHLKRYGMGDMMRQMALDRGMTIAELNKAGEKEEWTDRQVDEYQKKLAKEDNFIIDGRLSWHFIPDSIKVFLTVNSFVGAQRVMKDKRRSEKGYKSIEEAKKADEERVKSDVKRYKNLYGIDPYKIENYDIIIDTSDMSMDEMDIAVERAILRFIEDNK